LGREGPQQDSRKNNGLPEPEGARNKDKLLADREVHAKERKLSGHRVEHDAEKMKKKPSGHRVARDAKDDKYPGRRVERDVKGKLKDKLKGHREEQDAHRGGAGGPSHQKDDSLFAGCTTTRPKENKLSGHHVERDGQDARGKPYPEEEAPDVQKPRQTNLLPAGLALGKIDEMDPLHAELSEFLDRQQIAYLKAMSSRIEDKEFGDFMKQSSFEEKMSNYAGGEDHLPRGVGYTEPQTTAADKANQMRRVGQAGATASAGGDKQKSPHDIKAALEAAGWGPRGRVCS